MGAGTELSSLLQVGEIRWPVPERIVSGPVVNFGYADDLVLLSPCGPLRRWVGEVCLASRSRPR